MTRATTRTLLLLRTPFGGLLPGTLMLLALVGGLRFLVAPDAGLDLTRQAREPDQVTPGAGKEPLRLLGEEHGLRIVQHVAGVSRIPKRAERIVTLGFTDEVVGIGVTPVGAVYHTDDGFPEYLRPSLKDTLPISMSGGHPDLEALAALKPDLILAGWYSTPLWETLEAIAPTVLLQPPHWEWRQRVRDLGFACGRGEDAEAAIADCDQRLADARARIQSAVPGQSAAVLRIWQREFRLYTYAFSGPLIYGDLQFPRPRLVSDRGWDKQLIRLSLEGLSLLDADIIFLMVDEDRPIGVQVADRVQHHPLWNALPAVKAGRVYRVPNHVMRGGLVSRLEMADLLAREVCQ